MAYENQESTSGIERGRPEPDENRKAFVESLLGEIAADKKKWEPAFKRMRADMKFVRVQLPEEAEDDDRIKVNIVQRHIKQRVAALYAKNPVFIAQRRRRLDFKIWDEKRGSLEAAAAEVQQAAAAFETGQALPPSPETMALIQDIQEGISKRRQLDSVGRTLEVLFDHILDEQQPPFKPQCKQLVRRSVIAGAGYVKIAFQRQLNKRPDVEAKLSDITDRVAHFERLQADVADGEVDPNSAEVEELRQTLAQLQAEPDVVVREGLVYDFTSPLRVIPDRETRQLAVGFPGARRVTEEFLMTADEVKEVYGVDIGKDFVAHRESKDGKMTRMRSDAEKGKALVYECYDRKTGQLYVLCEGYGDFLREPAAPPLSYLEGYFPFVPLVFNPIEEEGEIFPESDVRLLRPIQREINRKAEAARQHRIASRPLYMARKGVYASEDDAKNLASHMPHEIIEFEGLETGTKLDTVFQPFPKVGVDPNLYETGPDLAAMQLVVGAQEANLGGTGGDSATESSIAEASRLASVASETDDLDDFLSILARMSGQVLLREMSVETVQRVAGAGAVWPEFAPEEISEEIYLEIEAGSAGRPNRERDLANFERVAPFLLQTPGIDPEWLAKLQIKLLDARIDYSDAITAGLPSITTMNRQTQVGTGDPATDPAQQGGAGAENAPNDDTSAGGPQAAMPVASTEQPNVPVA
jgi:hypothetical protein